MLPLIRAAHFLLESVELSGFLEQVVLIPGLPVRCVFPLELIRQLLAHFADTNELLKLLVVFGPVGVVSVLVVGFQGYGQELQSGFLDAQIQILMLLFAQLRQHLLLLK